MYGNADGWGAISTYLLGGKRRYTHTAVSREIVRGAQVSFQKTILKRVDLAFGPSKATIKNDS